MSNELRKSNLLLITYYLLLITRLQNIDQPFFRSPVYRYSQGKGTPVNFTILIYCFTYSFTYLFFYGIKLT